MKEEESLSALSPAEITAIIEYLAKFGGRVDLAKGTFSKVYKPVSSELVKYIFEKYKERFIEETRKFKKRLSTNPMFDSAYLLECCLDIYHSAMKEKPYSYKDASGEFVVEMKPEHSAATAAIRLAFDIKLDLEKLSIAKEKAGISAEDPDEDYSSLVEDNGLDLLSIDTPKEDLEEIA